MFAPLPPAPGSAPRSVLFSALVHGAGIVPLLLVTPALPASRGLTRDTTAVWLEPPPPQPAPDRSAAPDQGFTIAGAVPSGVIPPIEVPTTIPLPDFGPAPDWRHLLAPGPVPVPDSGPVGDPASDILPAGSVDVPARIIQSPDLDYPPTLRAAGIGGRVEAEFVVDTLGRVEPRSWRVLNDPHVLFERSARIAVLEARFEPARVRGRPVRQLVRQGFRFRIEPDR